MYSTKNKNKIIRDDETGEFRYYDNNGNELDSGDTVSIAKSTPQVLYRADDSQLFRDSLTGAQIAQGRSVESEYGIYPLTNEDMRDIIKVKETK